MKKILFLIATITGLTLSAQDDSNSSSLAKNSWLIEINTGSFATGNTAFSLTSSDGFTAYSAGADAGYFVSENFAIKAGLGYTGGDGISGTFVYKAGIKYYVIGEIPIGIDFTGASSDGTNANWIGLQVGYAIFVAKNVSLEPTLRYNATLDDTKADNAFQGLIGFVFHF